MPKGRQRKWNIQISAYKGQLYTSGRGRLRGFDTGAGRSMGADVIRDSDGTRLSDEIVNAGYGIYSTICIIRDHNEWARAHMDRLQQTFLMSAPKTAKADTVIIGLLDGYFKEQFLVNGSEDSLEFWQVFDRTDNAEVPREPVDL